MKQTLIFEADNGGHRQEFIEHLIEHINSNRFFKDRFVFLLNKDLVHSLTVPTKTLQIEEIEPNLTIKQEEYRILEVLETYKNIDTILFMSIDAYLTTVIRLAFKKSYIKIKGILFQPFHQFPKESFFDIKSLRFRKKSHLLAALLLNWKIKEIFILNDEKGVKKLNNWSFLNLWKRIFSYLPDPVDCRNKINSIDKNALLSQLGIEKSRHILLAFGAIDERKNTLNSIKSLTLLDKEIQSKVCLLIVGKNALDDKEALPKMIEKAMRDCTDLQIIWQSQFVTDEEREQLFLLSDIVIMPYINFFASSGVLGHAIKYGKRVIGSNQGVMNDIISKYQLGELVNPMEIGSITEGVEKTMSQPSQVIENQKVTLFLAAHTPELFAKKLLEA